MKDANHDGSGNEYPDNSWERTQELGAQANELEQENAALKKEIVRLKALLFRNRRAIKTIHSIASDMQDPEREHGPVD